MCSISRAASLQVKIEKPIMRIPMLAIHLNRDISTKGFELNKHTHLVPVLASAVQKAANKAAAPASDGNSVEADGQNKRHKVDGAGDAADLTPETVKVGRFRRCSLCSCILPLRQGLVKTSCITSCMAMSCSSLAKSWHSMALSARSHTRTHHQPYEFKKWCQACAVGNICCWVCGSMQACISMLLDKCCALVTLTVFSFLLAPFFCLV